MKFLKLNKLEKEQLSSIKGGLDKFKEKFDEEMDLLDSTSCSCACAYVNTGGSSSSDNNAANNAGGLNS